MAIQPPPRLVGVLRDLQLVRRRSVLRSRNNLPHLQRKFECSHHRETQVEVMVVMMATTVVPTEVVKPMTRPMATKAVDQVNRSTTPQPRIWLVACLPSRK